MVNRKLVRPNLAEIKERMALQSHHSGSAESPQREIGGNGAMRRRPVPPDATAAEAFYYLKQMNGKTPMVVVLNDGEELRGVIEWYDKNAIKVNRFGSPNLLVMKPAVKYMYKAEELNGAAHPDQQPDELEP
jgi:host factor-I protein